MEESKTKFPHHETNYELESQPQFSWIEGLWLGIVSLTYVTGFFLQIAIICAKYFMDEPPDNRHLYIIFFFLPIFLGATKNIQYHIRSRHKGTEDQTPLIVAVALFPFSPLIRYVRAWRFGTLESEDKQNGERFVDELLTGSVLRLFDTFLGDAPTLSLLVSSDVWGNSDAWKATVMAGSMPVSCGIKCANLDGLYVPFFQVFAIIFLLIKMAQGITVYMVVTKRWQHIQYPNRYSRKDHDGRLNMFASLLLYLSNVCFIGSRIMGYSMVASAWGSWVYFILGSHWLLNSGWHLMSIMMNNGFSAARSLNSLVIGGVWLFGLTNEESGKQLGRYMLYYFFSFADTSICCYLWIISTKGSGDFFEIKAPWATLVVFGMGLLLHLMYYSLCHPGQAELSIQGLLCCSPNRRNMAAEDDDDSTDTDASPV